MSHHGPGRHDHRCIQRHRRAAPAPDRRAAGLPQPAVSKHLGVLREVGIVSAEKHGQQRVYRLEGKELKHVYEWVSKFERHWSHQLARIKHRAERLARERVHQSRQPHRTKGISS